MERELDPATLGDHVDRLYRAAWALCGRREDAEDLVQDTYARVLARPRFLRGEDDLGYLLRVLRNTFLNWLRTQSRRPRTAELPEGAELVEERSETQPELSGGNFGGLTTIVLAQGEHGVSRCRVSHEAPDVRRWTTSLIYGERRPKALRPVLVTHQPRKSPPQVNIVAGDARLFQRKRDQACGISVAVLLLQCSIMSYPRLYARFDK